MKDFCFKIFNSTWNVSFIDNFKNETKEETFKFGETNYQHNKIKIATKNIKCYNIVYKKAYIIT